MKLTIYTNGTRLLIDNMISIAFNDKHVMSEIDLSAATEEELASLRQNPNNQLLIDEIRKRVV